MGWKVAWSDRMVSFYFLTPVFGIIYAILRRFGCSIRPISLKLLLLLLLPMFLDVITHIASDISFGISANGFRDTNAWLALITGNVFAAIYAGDHFGTFNWWMRLPTGALAAWGVAFFAFPWLDWLMAKEWAVHCANN